MDWPDILRRIQEGEGRQTECKRGLGDLKKIGAAVCAFANTEGGVVILGVDDTGTVVGVKEDPDRVQERLANFLQSGCSAPVSARCGRHQHAKGWVHWIEVPRQRGYEPLRSGGRVWVRRERSNVEPSPSELQELYNAFGYILTEERAIQAASPADIDLQAFRAYLRALGLEIEAEPQSATEDDLRNRGVLAELDGRLHPTLSGDVSGDRATAGAPAADAGGVLAWRCTGEDAPERLDLELPGVVRPWTDPRSALLLALAEDKDAALLDLRSGTRATPPLRTGGVHRAALAPHGDRVAVVATGDGGQAANEVRILAADGRWIGAPLVHPDGVEALSFTADGRLLTGAADGVLRSFGRDDDEWALEPKYEAGINLIVTAASAPFAVTRDRLDTLYYWGSLLPRSIVW